MRFATSLTDAPGLAGDVIPGRDPRAPAAGTPGIGVLRNTVRLAP